MREIVAALRGRPTWALSRRRRRGGVRAAAARARGGGARRRTAGAGDGGRLLAAPRPLSTDLDGIAFPARELLPNEQYISFGKQTYGYSITTVMSTRGCPFDCEFCSNVVFGDSYRERSPGNVVDEIEQALALGYERISFADDVFTLNARRVIAICEEIARRGLRFAWECLGRVDAFDRATALAMKERRLLPGLLRHRVRQRRDPAADGQADHDRPGPARRVRPPRRQGSRSGAFFILCYPGETDDTVLDTLRFATSLPLDYVGLTMPYPLPGTALLERVGGRRTREWRPGGSLLLDQVLTFEADFSATKMRFAILKGRAQFEMKRRLGTVAPPALRLFEKSTDRVFRLLR